MKELEHQFLEDMVWLCKEIKEVSHNPSRFIQMIGDGKEIVRVATRLVINEPTETFLRLAELDRLDLTVEYYVSMDKYQSLFNKDVIEIASSRLNDCRKA